MCHCIAIIMKKENIVHLFGKTSLSEWKFQRFFPFQRHLFRVASVFVKVMCILLTLYYFWHETNLFTYWGFNFYIFVFFKCLKSKITSIRYFFIYYWFYEAVKIESIKTYLRLSKVVDKIFKTGKKYSFLEILVLN